MTFAVRYYGNADRAEQEADEIRGANGVIYFEGETADLAANVVAELAVSGATAEVW